ncbi:MAG: response regulator [Deltaproteobacteria bacterium]|nr:response regulator [Deltaproteobacteria bacterium]
MFPDSFTKAGERVLVVDDSETNRTLLRAILRTGGYQVDELQNGGECLEYCSKELPSMILLDVMMPEVNGIDACRRLREQHSKTDLPIIMVTTLAENSGLAQSLAAGANDYVVKPIDRATLLARIENQMALSHAQRRIEHQARVLEKALRIQSAMGDILPEAIVIHDETGNIIYSNQMCHSFCGNRSEISITALFDSMFGGKYSSQMQGFYRRAASDPGFELAHELSHEQEPFRNVLLLTKPIPMENGALRLWVWRDDSATRALERAVNQRVKLDTVGLFAAGVAHNFNNIMGGILGASDVLERLCGENERVRRCMGVIRRGLDSGMRLTRKMNAAYHKDLKIADDADNDIASVLEQIASCYAVTLDGRITVTLNCEQDMPRVSLPGASLVEVFGNVISNSIESIPGTGNILLSALYRKDAKCVEVVISDSGCGMSADTLERMYEPFFSTKNFDQLSGVSVEGRGLGMWNTYNLMQGCGGSMQVSSEVGVGTTITLRFPIVAAE